MNAFLAQYKAELRLMLRQGEQMLVSIGVPVGILVFFSKVNIGTFDKGRAVDYLTPATMALCIMSTSMVSLGIGTAFERDYRVLKRLGATPLGRGRWLAAKLAVVGTIQIFALALLAAIGTALGWHPHGPVALMLPAAVLGTAAFCGLGLFLAGRLSATMNLAVTNGLYLALLVTGGMIVPFDKLPERLRALAEILPAAPLSALLVDSAGARHIPTVAAWIVLAFWAVALPALAARTFRWEPEP